MTSISNALPRRHRDLFGMLGHELRNPIAAVLAGVSVAAEMTDPDDPRAVFLDHALDDLRRVAALLDGCLVLGSADRLRDGADVDLTALATRVAQRYPAGLVTVCGQRRPVVVPGGAALLERALENLVDNAAAAGATEVTVATSDDGGDRAQVHVGDNGPGVPGQVVERLFEPFVSGHGSSGLGLAIVRRIAEAHGGDVRCLPSPRGALFCIELPRR